MTLSKEAKTRMDGLVNLNHMDDLRQSANKLAKQLLEDGFEREDIEAYLTDIIKQEIFRAHFQD